MNYTIHAMNYVMQRTPRRSHHLKAGARIARSKRPVSSSISSPALADEGCSPVPETANADSTFIPQSATVKKKGELALSQSPRALGPLVIPPFERRVPGMESANGAVAGAGAGNARPGRLAKFSPFIVACPYCEGQVSMRAVDCPHCKRGLLDYWLWDKVVYKRLFLLAGAVAIVLAVVGKVLLSYSSFQW